MSTALLTAPEGSWATTAAAAHQLGISSETLRRYARSGYLRPGDHYRPGLLPNSPWVWRVEAVAHQLLELSTEREQPKRGSTPDHEEGQKLLAKPPNTGGGSSVNPLPTLALDERGAGSVDRT